MSNLFKKCKSTWRKFLLRPAEIAALHEKLDTVSLALERQALDVQLVLQASSALQDRVDALRAIAHTLEPIRSTLEQHSAALREVRDSQSSVEQSVQQMLQLTSHLPDLQHVADCLEGVHQFKITEWVGILRYLRKVQYLQAIARQELPVPELNTQFPMAVDSNDSLHPRGAKNDNSIVPRFNQRIYELLGPQRQLSVLDLGCAGGGFVRSLIDDGHVGVGLEGSDYPRRVQKDEWSTIPHHLHTCDITKPFQIVCPKTGQPWLFDAVTAWEFLEHIAEEDIPTVLANIQHHLKAGGYVFMSVATFPDTVDGVVYHHTVQPEPWWRDVFRRAQFDIVDAHSLSKDDWVRGSGHCFGDWHEDQQMGFHLVLRTRVRVGQQPGHRIGRERVEAVV